MKSVSTKPSASKSFLSGPGILGASLLIATSACSLIGNDAPPKLEGEEDAPNPATTTFASTIFRATHNSYSGGDRGSILHQLDHGVRFIELDLHSEGFRSHGDYMIGHGKAGEEVDHGGGNPASNRLTPWLLQISHWSDQHPNHAPIIVMFDLKEARFDANASFADGNFGMLNAKLQSVFGDALLRAEDVPGPLPNPSTLRGRILTLLGGDGHPREAYKRDTGNNPAVAVNGHGQIVEVNDSGDGALWYWSGVVESDGRVTWKRHGRYDSGQTPAVALNDDGWIVEVHQSENAQTLWYNVGHLAGDGEITWSAGHRYDSGILPSVRFVHATGTEVHEIHRSEVYNQNWDWDGTIQGSGETVRWYNHGKTCLSRYPVATSVSNSAQITVWTGRDGTSRPDTLLYRTDRVGRQRIRFPQLAFVEYDDEDVGNEELHEGALFYGARAGSSKDFIIQARREGHIVRAYRFGEGDITTPLTNYPATDTPYIPWYVSLLNRSRAVE